MSSWRTATSNALSVPLILSLLSNGTQGAKRMAHSVYLVQENLVLRARSELHGFAGKDGEWLKVSVFRFQVYASMFLFPDT
jgi:hypothetical protein